ncbi:MAG: excalibur calcium-binding domain-containing protein [Sphingorhabdus sp.]
MVLSAATFGLIFFQDSIPSTVNATIQMSRNLGRENAPPVGAYYSGCNDARAAGVAPLYSGEPGYRPEMDGDGDGIACEPYRGM